MRQIAIAAALIALVVAFNILYPPEKKPDDLASCYANKPVNVILCSDWP